jgi:hypothetical protein
MISSCFSSTGLKPVAKVSVISKWGDLVRSNRATNLAILISSSALGTLFAIRDMVERSERRILALISKHAP